MQHDAAIRAFWQGCRAERPEWRHPDVPTPEAWGFGADPAMANRLGALVVAGVKTATRSQNPLREQATVQTDLARAEALLRSALEQEPEEADFAAGLMILYLQQGRRLEALPVARRLVELAPEDASARALVQELERQAQGQSPR